MGKKAFKVISTMLLRDPTIEDLIFKVVGDKTKKDGGPTSGQVSSIRTGLYTSFGFKHDHASQGRTELDAQLYEQWTYNAKDPDVDVVAWLRGGTPMGVEENMTPRGVFPTVSEATPEESRRPLEQYHEDFRNYRSAELDQDSWHALQELVGSGFVQRFDSERSAIEYLRGQRPVSSKLALVKNGKGGVVKWW